VTGVGIGMILDSAKSKIRFTAETFFQLVRCGPVRGLPFAGGPAAVPAFRWSVASGGGHGSGDPIGVVRS